MNTITKEKTNIKDAFESILRADYISIDGFDQLDKLEKYYIDTFNNLGLLLQRQDNYLAGRRGTGKTTLLMRGYYECLKSISPKLSKKENSLGDKKILPIYIDLTSCNDLFSSENELELLELHFIRQIIANLKSQLEIMFDEKYLGIFKKANPALDDLDYIETILVEGLKIKESSNISVQTTMLDASESSVGGNLNLANPTLQSNLKQNYSTNQQREFNEVRGINIQEFLKKISDIKKNANIDSIFIFLDEFSDLNNEAQLKLSSIIKSLLGNKINMFFKVGVITDRYTFGDKIILGRDLYPISLDLNDVVEKLDGAVSTLKKLELHIGDLIEKRLSAFCAGVTYSTIFDMKKEVLCHRLARASLGVTRTLGWVLQNAWMQCINSDGTIGKIKVQDLNFGIRSARKMHYKQFQGSVKGNLIPGYYMDMWNRIIEKAMKEKNKHPDRPASHILLDPIRKDYMNKFCENFMLTLLEEGRSSKAGGNYNLYAIDYDICTDFKIKFAEEKDEFTAIRFIYDNVLSEFDPYFVKDKIKSYKCPECGTIYEESEVAHVKVKRCHEDDEKLEEIIHKEVPMSKGNFVEVETKILGLINDLDEQEAMSAQEIADVVGCSRHKVSNWGSKVLAKQNLINIKVKGNKNYYFSNNI
ncbi:hypothetical protein P4T38_06175 [Bacillus safensis]|uniref:ORC-CDC6 family AAA ATPase n=1 Tax=Bacillus safensis TaxID=561879 RepID=UPI00228299F8|nr:hypothetical protein [Bacillus safensis]MCY7708061.1 hypothetical protein [Bacillus safensis]MCY7727423.1 hypothetical protein [Bacillus safensis]MED0882284.1 hypothetical protein [Bacillus safensis]MED0917570.1 hypothetical protein [Bacillus safensis]